MILINWLIKIITLEHNFRVINSLIISPVFACFCLLGCVDKINAQWWSRFENLNEYVIIEINYN